MIRYSQVGRQTTGTQPETERKREQAMFAQESLIELGCSKTKSTFNYCWSGEKYTYVLIDKEIHFLIDTGERGFLVGQHTGNLLCGCLGKVTEFNDKKYICTTCNTLYETSAKNIKQTQKTDLNSDKDHLRKMSL